MNEENNQDVNNVDETTTLESSPNEETPVEASQDENPQESKTVPYERFAEVNETAKQTKAEIEALKAEIAQMRTGTSQEAPKSDESPEVREAKKQLESLFEQFAKERGFVSQAELRQKEQDQQLKSELKSLEDRYNGKDGRPAFKQKDIIKFAYEKGISDPEVAYKVKYEKELDNWKIEQALTKTRGVATESSNGSGSANAGTTDDDLKKASLAGNQDAHIAYLKRLMPKG